MGQLHRQRVYRQIRCKELKLSRGIQRHLLELPGMTLLGRIDLYRRLAKSYLNSSVPGFLNSLKGFDLTVKAAELGCISSSYTAAWMAYKGELVPQNFELAVKFLQKPVQRKHIDATRLVY